MTKSQMKQFETLTPFQQGLIADLGYAIRNIAELSDMLLTKEYVLTERQANTIKAIHKQAVDLRCEILMDSMTK